MSLPPRERPARFAAISLVPRAGPLVIAVLASLAAVHARSAGTKAASPCTGAAVVAPHARSALQPLGEVCPRHRGLAVSRLRRSLVVAGPVGRSLPSSRSVLPCARRSSPLALASGSRGWRPSHHVVLLRRAHGDGDEDDTTVTEVNGGAQLSSTITEYFIHFKLQVVLIFMQIL